MPENEKILGNLGISGSELQLFGFQSLHTRGNFDSASFLRTTTVLKLGPSPVSYLHIWYLTIIGFTLLLKLEEQRGPSEAHQQTRDPRDHRYIQISRSPALHPLKCSCHIYRAEAFKEKATLPISWNCLPTLLVEGNPNQQTTRGLPFGLKSTSACLLPSPHLFSKISNTK